MASYVCLFVLCFLVAAIESHVIRADRVRIPPQGMTIEISIKPNEEYDLARRIKDIFTKKEDWDVEQETAKPITTTTDLPKLEKRLGIQVGLCPVNHVSRGGFCFPDYE